MMRGGTPDVPYDGFCTCGVGDDVGAIAHAEDCVCSDWVSGQLEGGYDENDPLQNRAIAPDRRSCKERAYDELGIATESVDARVYPYKDTGHYHTDGRGLVHRCYHHCRHRWYIWIPLAFVLQSLAVPLEHDIAEWFWNLGPLHVISDFMGWGHDK